MQNRIVFGTFVSVLALVAGSQVAQAQDAEPSAAPAAESDSAGGGDVIVVTARKRQEDVLKTPIAVSAFDSAALEARGIDSLQDLTDFTPGMSINSAASGRSDRSFQSIIIRGFTPTVSTNQTASVFIDGVPVSSPTAIQNLGDPARIEVIKGPQSAYFGRQTFAGAVNVVTKDVPEEFSGSIAGMLGTRNNREIAGEVGGPLIGDILGFRATARYWGKDGSYENKGIRGQTLGDQSTTSGTLALTFKPASNFTAKAFGLWSENKDGPNATALISARSVVDPAGNVVVADQSNCVLNGVNPYLCGTLPGLSPQQPSANTADTQYIKAFLANPKGRLLNPKDGTQGYGLRSRYYHLHLGMDWEVSDSVTLSSLTGYNDEIKSQLSDLKVWFNGSVPSPYSTPTNGVPPYFDYPYIVEFHYRDFSQELRASFDNGGPFRAIVGASYLNSFFQSGGGGSPAALGTTAFATVSGKTKSKTYGGFFGLTYDVTPELSVSVDGRYQIDDMTAYARPGGQLLISDAFAPAGFYPEGTPLVGKTYKNFMPRAIVNYQVMPEMMVYASYSKGLNPGVFNTVFLSRPAATQQAAADAGLQIAVEPEELDNFEVGFKGRAFGNKLTYAISAYYGIWDKQLNSQQITLVNPDTGIPDTFQATSNSGKVKVKGIEAELTAYPFDQVMINATGAINDTSIVRLTAPSVTALTGITDFKGKQNPLTPKYTASFSAQYTYPVPSLDDTEIFVRGDFAYKSGIYTNAANLTKTPDYTQVNLRIGANSGNLMVEGFVTNLFNNKAYPSAIDYNIIEPTLGYFNVNSAVAVGLRELRTFGVRTKYSF